MIPDAIDLSPCEERVVGSSHPVGQRFQSVDVAGQLQRVIAQIAWRHSLMCSRLLHFPLPCFPNHLLAVELMSIEPVLTPVFQNLVLDASEEGRQAVVVLLRPLVKRMIVALGALQANAEKHLAKSFGPAFRIT